ncbi:hypothetical protein UVI_02042220 [Ustilaginoidea virens]|uniref:Survival Motor Neuron Gemin2-binding domain-containing protein n=1 Tax=Ustilaginoidea virens TaxID=1159556 RepID=A0A1B5L4L6_USTVR|nr:hypothetical protein UVI_02042220 [Ustilaginoidea virens]
MSEVQAELSQEEIWDDSALIDSWNEALAEYKISPAEKADASQDAAKTPVPVAPPPQALLGSSKCSPGDWDINNTRRNGRGLIRGNRLG